MYKSLNVSATTAHGNIQHIAFSKKRSLLGDRFLETVKPSSKDLQIFELESSEVVSKVGVNQHDITEERKFKLVIVTKGFPSFTDKGLRKTSLITYSNDVGNAKTIKQPYFPVSLTVDIRKRMVFTYCLGYKTSLSENSFRLPQGQ